MQVYAVMIITCIYYYKSRDSYQVLQVTCAIADEHDEIEGLYDKIMITIVPSCTRKISLVCYHWHCYLCYALITIQMATISYLYTVEPYLMDIDPQQQIPTI